MDEKKTSGGPDNTGPLSPGHPDSTPAMTNFHDQPNPTMLGRHSLQIIQGQLPATSEPQISSEKPLSGTISDSSTTSKPHIVLDENKSSSLPDKLDKTIPPTPLSPAHPKPRASHDFDQRFDGPFGRPSINPPHRPSHHSSSRPRLSETSPRTPAEDPVPHPRFQPTPPSLNYTLRTRKLSIFLFWALILFDSIAMPIALYFGLWYGVGPGTNTPTEKKQKLTPNAVFSIVTAAVGGASIVEYFLRFWRLWRKGSTCRVIGAHRWYLDWFHWNFSFAWIIIMIELIVGTVPEHPPIRLLSMPVTTMLFVFGTELLVVDILHAFHVPAPCRISSIPKGAQLRPGIYSLIEDICSVDGSGQTEFRVALDRRYEASHVFRAMLRRLGVFWAVGAEACAVLCTVLIFTLSGDAAYTIGWSLPFVWAGIWSVATIWFVKWELKRESKAWAEEAARKGPGESLA
ncbi:hypothetical protein C8035_v009070 [Colletotrichum spinosum]|uniref:Uncharacterized protein n=1 Tax=Colletotrichum spinosum TaxID=1347390 RepID=A0A4V3HSK4_9PEZI|nr:hypothetical protein C8035_v009070 [Colletotrichum spinosum]